MSTSSTGVINFSHLTLTLIYRCNYRCPSCLVGDKLSSKECLSYEDAVRIIDSAADLDTIGIVAFVGGEPFLVHPLMVRIAKYIFENYRVPLTASTNSFWASSLDKARRKLEPLASNGMKSLLLSWDDFHALFGNIQQVANAITVCGEFNIQPTVQNIYLKGATRIDSIKDSLSQLCDAADVKWVENPCVPIGLGSEIDLSKQMLVNIDDIPYGRCTAGTVVNIQANGEVKPCCGAGLMADRLTMGNSISDALVNIVRKSSVDPIINSLVAYKGPKHLVDVLRHANREDLVPDKVTDPCDACQKILCNGEAYHLITESLKTQQLQMLLTRVASEEFSRPIYQDASESAFSAVPNFDSADLVPALRIDDFYPGFFHDRASVYRRPIILRTARLAENDAVEKWGDSDYLRRRAGDWLVEVTRGLILDKHHKKVARFSEYLDFILNECYSKEQNLYMRFHEIPKPLVADIEVPICAFKDLTYHKSSMIKLFIGRYSYTDSHEHGGYDAFMYQITGQKEVLLHEPTKENVEALYVGTLKNWSPVRFLQPDCERYPLFKGNKPTYAVVQPGEALYIPDGWFHAVSSVGDELAITMAYFFPAEKKGSDFARPLEPIS